MIITPNYLMIKNSLISYFDSDGKNFVIENHHIHKLKIIQQNAVSGPNIETVVVPEGVSLKQIYLFDSVSYISPYCFGEELPPDLNVYFTGSVDNFKSKGINSEDTFETMFKGCKVYINEGNGDFDPFEGT